VNLDKQVFHCFYAGCEFSGGIGALRNRLGLRRERVSKGEWIRRRREQERAHDAAVRLYVVAHARQLELREGLRLLGRAEIVAYDAGPDDPHTWEILSTVYQRRPEIEGELDALENCGAAEVLGICGGRVQ
jgi:hypothetical protein